MTRETFLTQLHHKGANTTEALARFMGNEELFLSFVSRLPEKLKFDQIRHGLEVEDEDEFYMGVHNLKGMAGNLSLEPIYDCAQAILVEFRVSKFQNRKKLTALTREAEAESEALAEFITQYLTEKEEP